MGHALWMAALTCVSVYRSLHYPHLHDAAVKAQLKASVQSFFDTHLRSQLAPITSAGPDDK